MTPKYKTDDESYAGAPPVHEWREEDGWVTNGRIWFTAEDANSWQCCKRWWESNDALH